MPLRKAHYPRSVAVALAVAAAALTAPGAASAVSVASLSQNLTCSGQLLSTPLAKWGDTNSYWLAPDGGFELGGSTWTKTNATVVAGNETLGVLKGAKSLKLGGAATTNISSATSPTFCIDPLHPTFRFIYKSNSASTVLNTYINFVASTGATLTVPAKVNTVTIGAWSLSASQPLATTIPSVFLGTGTTASITFKVVTPTLAGSVNIDNVLIDPYRRG